jgi:transcriptional regulator with XRE-family HTH domain
MRSHGFVSAEARSLRKPCDCTVLSRETTKSGTIPVERKVFTGARGVEIAARQPGTHYEANTDMHFTIDQASDIGGVIRAARKAQQLRQDDAAGSIGVSESFLGKAEAGAESVQWGKLFLILEGLGVRLSVDIPDADEDLLKAQSTRAQHRAAVREFRAAEQSAEKWKLPGVFISAPADIEHIVPKERAAAFAELIQRAQRVLDTASPDARASETLRRARNVIAHASKTNAGKGSTRK